MGKDCGKDQAASSKNEAADEDKFVIKSIEVSEPDLEEEEEEEDGIHSEGSAAGIGLVYHAWSHIHSRHNLCSCFPSRPQIVCRQCR